MSDDADARLQPGAYIAAKRHPRVLWCVLRREKDRLWVEDTLGTQLGTGEIQYREDWFTISQVLEDMKLERAASTPKVALAQDLQVQERHPDRLAA